MCGIAGAVNFKLSYKAIDKAMLHRGPDDQNGWEDDNIDFYHLRLSIVDIGGGKQPMHLDDRYTIIFNGEIYNHLELRSRFKLQCNTGSDTETLLRLYQQFGTGFLQHLDGMFAFAIYDNVEKRLFIARDRAGKKPLYYYKEADKFVFASELNCLRSLLPLQMNQANFYHYLRLGSFYRALTPYHNVTELTNGSFLMIDCKSLAVNKTCWWNISDYYKATNKDSIAESLEKVDAFLHEGVKRRVESSDLEVGCFLSGGIDSGLVTAIAKQYNQSLKTFTISFGGEYNEAPLAKLVADKYETVHTEINICFDHLKNDLEMILSNYGEPFFDSSAVPSYYVSAEARKHLTVVLNGDGADELFGGYRRYVPFARYDFFRSGLAMRKTASFFHKVLPPAHQKKSKYNYLYRLASFAAKDNLDIYLAAGVDIMEDYTKYIESPPAGYMNSIEADFDAIANADMTGLKKLMNMDFNATLFSQLLVKMDIASMANSLEGRSPFLSKELLEYVPGMNDKYKIDGTTTKYLLRKLGKKYLPATLLHQPKRGFEVPLKNWVNSELKDMVNQYVGSEQALNRQMIEPSFINALINNKVKIAAEKRAKILWTLLSMEVWYKKVYLQ